LNLQGYTLIEGNMNADQRQCAHQIGAALVANLAGSLLGYALLLGARRRQVVTWVQSPLCGIPIVIVQVAYLWLATTSTRSVLPASVTRWIYPEDRFLFNQFAFAMPPLFLGLFWLATLRAATQSARTIAASLSLAVGAPFLLYLGLQVAQRVSWIRSLSPIVFAVLCVMIGLLTFLGLIRGLFVGLRALRGRHTGGDLVAVGVIALAMPIGGLLLNRSIPFPVDFQSVGVYALSVGNALALAAASQLPVRFARLRLALLGVGLPFTLYFFFVFLPYTPLSVLAMVVMGAGFLVLTPTFLLALHVHLIGRIWHEGSRTRSAAAVGLLAAAVVPGLITVRALADRHALNGALAHLFQPAVSGADVTFPGSRAGLKRALASHRDYKDGIYYPLLSDFTSWLTFDGLILSDDKLAQLEQAFFGNDGVARSTKPRDHSFDLFGGSSRARDRHRMPRAPAPPRTVAITHLDVQTRSVSTAETTVTARLSLTHTGRQSGVGAEFIAPLRLPAGVFVTGFRLQVNGTWVPGRLIEKKTALWTYAMIRDSERRDPGLLYYLTPEELELRVFPVLAAAPSLVEFDLLVPSALADADFSGVGLDLNAVCAVVTRSLRPSLTRDPTGRLAGTGWTQARLPGVVRPAYLHLIVDRSEDGSFDAPLSTIAPLLAKRFPADLPIRISYANHDIRMPTRTLASQSHLPETPPEFMLSRQGGLLLDATLAQALQVHRAVELDPPVAPATPPPRPIFVILSRTAKVRPLVLPLTEAWSGLLDTFELHELGADGTWLTHAPPATATRPLLRCGRSVRPVSSRGAVSFRGETDSRALEFWSPDDAAWKLVPAPAEVPGTSPWSRAVALMLVQEDTRRSPGDSGPTLPELVSRSREQGVLLPSTSYIVVENEAQWRIMERTEARKLGQNEALDVLETPAPSVWILAGGVGLWLTWRRRRRRTAPAPFAPVLRIQ
ncbi:MAG: MSEP-CTERM sorting domain-containing protein, partial [Opitutaceae bacterium]|nr:MSEP-CTERM sorting domain-containing protein [Opitutaceae bacterium]